MSLEKSRRLSKAVLLGILLILGASELMWLERAEAQPEKKQSVRGGGVEVIAEIPEGPANVHVFRVSLDTHVVNLDVYSFREMVRLRDEVASHFGRGWRGGRAPQECCSAIRFAGSETQGYRAYRKGRRGGL